MSASTLHRSRRRVCSVPPRGGASLRAVAVLHGLLLVAVSLAWLGAGAARADSYDEMRVRSGARLFRAFLAADVGADGRPERAPVVLVYGRDRAIVEEVVQLIAYGKGDQPLTLRGRTIDVRAVDALAAGSGDALGVFLASAPPADELDALVQRCIAGRVLLFSPFEGHVERGVMAGLTIETRVRFHVNTQSLRAAGIQLKPLFMSVAKPYP